MGIFQVGVILGGNFPGGSCTGGIILVGNCPGGIYPGWEFSLVGVFRVGIVRGNHPGGNFPGGSFPSTLSSPNTELLTQLHYTLTS